MFLIGALYRNFFWSECFEIRRVMENCSEKRSWDSVTSRSELDINQAFRL